MYATRFARGFAWKEQLPGGPAEPPRGKALAPGKGQSGLRTAGVRQAGMKASAGAAAAHLRASGQAAREK
ncbi:MAG: hypothetical protein DBY17_06165 [Oscillospiraceae bacterium]|nr:MAG: hypothetical protein DBY17_06165 [Oscillospiraceae bacterium]